MSRPRLLRSGILVLAVLLALTSLAVIVRSDRRQGNLGLSVAVPDIYDSFDRDGPSLGAAPGRPPWQEAAGWSIARWSQAYAAAPAQGASLAIVRLGGADGAVEVRLAKVDDGAGLVFRYRDPDNYWAFTVVPSFATSALVRVMDGTSRVVAGTGLSALDDGMVIGVRLEGVNIDLVIDHKVQKTVRADELVDASGAGLIAQGASAGLARFEDFRFSLPGRR
jgi:hypothetical protein